MHSQPLCISKSKQVVRTPRCSQVRFVMCAGQRRRCCGGKRRSRATSPSAGLAPCWRTSRYACRSAQPATLHAWKPNRVIQWEGHCFSNVSKRFWWNLLETLSAKSKQTQNNRHKKTSTSEGNNNERHPHACTHCGCRSAKPATLHAWQVRLYVSAEKSVLFHRCT